MMPFGAGGGRGQGGEDSEHQRKVPIHGEPELFANDRETAPPVIGEDPPK